MRLLILGGTGPVGIQFTREALASLPDCTVILYARSPEKIPEDISSNKEHVVIIKGTFEDTEALSRAIEGVDAIISALGPSTKPSKAPFHPSDTPLAKAYASVIDLMKKHGVKRLIALGTASNKDTKDRFSYKFWVLVTGVATLAHNAYRDIVAVGETIRTKGAELEWTIARVPLLTNDESKMYVAGHVGDGMVTTQLSRPAYAAYVIGELKKREWIQEAPLVCSP